MQVRKKMIITESSIKHEKNSIRLFGMDTLLLGIIFFLIALGVGLGAYYTHMVWMRYVSLIILFSGITILFLAMKQDLDKETTSSLYSFSIIFVLLLIYFALRTALPRFDFSVGDASDYYMAGVCSVTYSQDIGFFLPLTASVTALGYTLFGIEYTPMINVILYVVSIPLTYFLFRRLGLSIYISVLMDLFLLLMPLSIWFSKTSFSDPIWQLMLLIFALLSLHITERERPSFQSFIALFLLLGLIPFLRGEAVLFYGLILFLSLYHLWKFGNLPTSLFIVSSFTMLVIGLYLALSIRAHYLLGWQFSRIIPKITEVELMNILYGSFVIAMLIMVVLSKVRQVFSHINLPFVVTVLAILFKVGIAYKYSIQKGGDFQDFFFMNEYSFMLGNFGLGLSLLIMIGLILLHYRAIRGDRTSLILVIMYAIFYIPFVMQNITFQDPHELFLYWNRYYFSILMIIHIFSLALVVQFIYIKINKILERQYKSLFITSSILLLLSLYSINTKVQALTVNEAYLENSYKVFPWLTERVGRNPISIIYDTSIKYRRHNGMYDIKVFLARMFTVVKISAKGWQKVSLEKLNKDLIFNPPIDKSKYLLCVSSRPCILENEELTLVDKIILPISWREHYQAQPKIKKKVEGKIENSLKNEVLLHVILYKINK